MGYLVQRLSNGSNTTYSGTNYFGYTAGTKKLHIQTGSVSSQRLDYPLTTNTSASQYCHFAVHVSGSKAYLARRTTGTFTTTSNNSGTMSISSTKSASYSNSTTRSTTRSTTTQVSKSTYYTYTSIWQDSDLRPTFDPCMEMENTYGIFWKHGVYSALEGIRYQSDIERRDITSMSVAGTTSHLYVWSHKAGGPDMTSLFRNTTTIATTIDGYAKISIVNRTSINATQLSHIVTISYNKAFTSNGVRYYSASQTHSISGQEIAITFTQKQYTTQTRTYISASTTSSSTNSTSSSSSSKSSITSYTNQSSTHNANI